MFKHPCLRVERRIRRSRHDATIRALVVHATHLHRVAEVWEEYLVAKDTPQPWIFDGEQDLDPPVEIARHEIGATKQYFFLMAVPKVEDPAMFEKSSHERCYGNMVAYAVHSRAQTADAADLKIDGHSSLRGPIQCLDADRICQGVELECDSPLAGVAMASDDPFDALEDSFAHSLRCDQETVIVDMARIPSQRIKQDRRIGSDRRVARQEREIGIDAGRRGIVVAGLRWTYRARRSPSRRTTRHILAWVLSPTSP